MHVISVKKNSLNKEELSSKHPRTELDVKFLAAVAEYMSKQGVSSDRAMSLALGRSENFLNRVRNGYQSATPEAWSALFDKYPEARNLTTNNITSQGSGHAVGINNGQIMGRVTRLAGDEKSEYVELPIELTAAYELITQLKSQLADKDRIIKLLEQNLNKSS